ncbi:hypothetical protein [Undibacterium sp. Xuan67W]|uniref:hypothetical protein n=1 Tax=Undibacterium sp. Xuan67W TaxID=3413057 RepID=UPI003BEFE664
MNSERNRVRLHLDRNNLAAQLLMVYCEKQTGWQNSREKEISDFSASLAFQHETVVQFILEYRRQNPTQWSKTSLVGVEGELLLFVHQNRELCKYLIQGCGIDYIRFN